MIELINKKPHFIDMCGTFDMETMLEKKNKKQQQTTEHKFKTLRQNNSVDYSFKDFYYFSFLLVVQSLKPIIHKHFNRFMSYNS